VDRKNILIFIVSGVAILFLFLFLVVLDAAKRGQDRVKKLEDEKSSLTAEIENLRGQQKALNEKIASLNGQIDTLNADKQQLKEKLTGALGERDGLKTELEKLNAEIVKVRGELEASRTEGSDLKQQLQAAVGRKGELETAVTELKAKQAALEASLDKMQAEMRAKEQLIESLKTGSAAVSVQQEQGKDSVKLSPIVVQGGQSKRETAEAPRSGYVELPQIVVSPEGVQQQPQNESRRAVVSLAKASVSVVAVNRDNNFVIVNEGSAQGVKTGDSLKVYGPDNRLAGELEVIQVRQDISAADIKKELQPLRVGFQVK
jgi:uncharacterized coiled-coil DUF342 family protein